MSRGEGWSEYERVKREWAPRIYLAFLLVF